LLHLKTQIVHRFELTEFFCNVNRLEYHKPLRLFQDLLQDRRIRYHIHDKSLIANLQDMCQGICYNNVIDDLVLQPWSLIPPQFRSKQIDVFDRGDQADIRIDLQSPHSRKMEIPLL
jgi:hypothetical protein